MTTAVSSAPASVYDPAAQMCFADDGGALPAAAVVLVEGISCGKDLAAYLECEKP